MINIPEYMAKLVVIVKPGFLEAYPALEDSPWNLLRDSLRQAIQ